MLPEVKKLRPCALCASVTEQKLVPLRTGAEWRCTVCQTPSAQYTLAQMRDFIAGVHLPAAARTPPSLNPEKVKIYLAHPEGELELALPFVKKHLEITGTLPKKGDPVFTRSEEAGSTPGLGLEIPYGQVTRVEVLP